MEKSGQEVMNDNVERRLNTLEEVSSRILLAVERQSVMIGLMAKVFVGGGGLIGIAILAALLNLVMKHPVYHG